MIKKIRARAAAEHGQSLVIVALAMVAVIAMAALAIDVGTWYEKHHQAQVAADGAALAAANCMANAGSSGDSCTSATDTSDATTVAETYASDNGVTITSSDIAFDMTKDTVTVTTPNPAPAFFASIVGIHSTTPTAKSTATWTSEEASTCTTTEEGKGDCYAIFAYDSTCANDGVDVTTNNTVINGAIHSNGDISNNGNNNTKLEGPNSYGSGAGCKNPSGSKSVTETQDPSSLCYPIDYSGLTPNPSSCGGTDASPDWTATSSYCTVTINSSATYTIPTSGGHLVPGVYCDTTSGTVNVSGSAASASAGVTVVAQNFNLTSAGTLYPYTSSAATASNQLVLYQYTSNWNGSTCSGSSPGLTINGNTSFNLNGTIFAPCAFVDYQANNTTMVGFIEGYDVLMEGANMTGSGPAPTGAGDVINTPGADSLTF